MDYGKVLTDAWNTIWKHKILWLLGILAGCGSRSGSSSSGNSSSSNVNYSMDEGDFNSLPPQFQQFFDNVGHFLDKNAELLWLYATLFFIVILVIALIMFFIRVYGQVGLVRGALLANSGKLADNEKLTFGQIHSEALPYFWRLAGLRALLFLVGLVVGLLIAGVLILGTFFTFGIGLICLLPLICLLVPVGWVIQVVIKQAELAIIVEDMSFTDALRRGFEIVRDNPGPYAIMALILLLGGGIITLIFAIPQFMAMAPILAAFMSSAFSEDWSNILTGLWISLACLVAYWPVITVLRGILTSYIETSWLLTFLEVDQLDQMPDEPKIINPELEPA